MRFVEAQTLALLAAVVIACGSSGKVTPVESAPAAKAGAAARAPASYGPEHVGIPLPGPEVCGLSAGGEVTVAEGSYHALLRNARCEQQKFATMAKLALTLDVSCSHCHAPHPSDPNKENYPLDTPNKAKASWMYQTFVQGLRPIDGSPTMCSSCHLDPDSGEPVAKILGDPRDPVRTMEWMHEMTARFVTHDGERLRCKTCHQGMAPGTDGWLPNMVGEDWLRLALSPLSQEPKGPPEQDVASSRDGGGGSGGGPAAAEAGQGGDGGAATAPTSAAGGGA